MEIPPSSSAAAEQRFRGIHPLLVATPVAVPSCSSHSHSRNTLCLSRLVTEHPTIPGACIETVLQQQQQQATRSRLRVVVQSGPDSSSSQGATPTLHASFQLPADAVISRQKVADENDDGTAMNPIMTWAAFPEENDENKSNKKNDDDKSQQKIKKATAPPHKLLCVLINPNAVAIYDVYPSSSTEEGQGSSVWTAGEGWTVSLPFDCSAIYALGDSGGLLLQRLPDALDQPQQQQQEQAFQLPNTGGKNKSNTMKLSSALGEAAAAAAATAFVDHDDDFVLQPPHKISRRSTSKKGTSSSNNAAAANVVGNSTTPRPPSSVAQHMTPGTNVAAGAAATGATAATSVPSLFSLKHPMQDPAPVVQVSSAPSTSPPQQQQGEQQQQGSSSFSHAIPFTDAWTEILFLGTASWVDPDADYIMDSKKVHNQVIAVTYRGGRHAVWTLQDAPAPPPSLPLYQQTRLLQQYANPTNAAGGGGGSAKDHRGHAHPDVFQEDWELFGIHEEESGVVVPHHIGRNVDDVVSQALLADPTTTTNMGSTGGNRMSTGHSSSRTEALAEALGVRKTPRKSLDASAAAAVGFGAAASTTSTMQHHHRPHPLSTTSQHGRGGGGNNNASMASAASFFSPTHHQMAGEAEQAGNVSSFFQSATTHAGSTFGPFASIHSDVSMTCLYVEPTSQPRAKKVFLASNTQASGTLSLCLVIPKDDNKKSSSGGGGGGSRRNIASQFGGIEERSANTSELQILSLCPTPSTKATGMAEHMRSRNRTFLPKSGYSLSVQSPAIPPVPCINARPLQVQPVPACFLPHPKYRPSSSSHVFMATDILVLSRGTVDEDSTNNYLTLYRQGIPFLPCALNNGCWIAEIIDPSRDRVTFHCRSSSMGKNMTSTRGSLSLLLMSDSAEMALSAVETSLYAASRNDEDDNNNNKLVQVALRLRADCARLAQTISMTRGDNAMTLSSSPLHSLAWSALETVMLSTLVRDWKGKFVKGKQPARKETDAWKLLLETDFHHSYDTTNAESLFLGPLSTKDSTVGSNDDSSLRDLYSLHGSLVKEFTQSSAVNGISRYLFDSLHLLYEDWNLCSRGADAGMLGLLVQICKIVLTLDPANKTAGLFLDYYETEMGKTCMDFSIRVPAVARGSVMAVVFSNFEEPPCLLDWVNDTLRGRTDGTESGSYFGHASLTEMNATCARTRSLCRFFSILFSTTATSSSVERDFEVVRALLEEGYKEQSLLREELRTGIALPLLDVLYRCRQHDSLLDVSGWSAEACLLVGREDLGKNMTATPVHSPPLVHDYSQSKDFMAPESEQEETKSNAFSDEDNDGLLPLELTSSMWFPEDNRVHEAARLLRSSRPIFLRVPRAIEVSDHEFEQLKQKKLSLLVRRTLALPLGRGMMTIGSLRPVAAEPLPLPDLCLKGRVPPTNATLTLEQAECPPDMRVWPEFHNGVAAGLRLPVKGEPGEAGAKITRTWIVYNRPPRKNNQSETEENGNTVIPPPNIKSHSHGGLLLALGLRGHLGALRMTDIYEYLTQGAVTTTVGVLLGMAANKRGSCDTAVSKMICLHIPSLIPQHFSAIDVASSVQTAAVTGAGLLFQGSSHRMMTEFLLNEIGKRPESDMSAFDREAYTLSCGLALGMVNLCLREKSDSTDRAAGIADLQVEERLRRYINGGEANEDESRRLRESNDRFSLPSAASGADNEKCSIIHEGNQINTQMTSPGATLALGLMYMKTGNHTIASAVRVPNTHFLLEFVRPDFLGLRIVAKSLILWDEVRPSKEWIESQVPSVVQQAYYSMRAVAKSATEGKTPVKAARPAEYDRRAVRQIYIYVVAGACFGMGLRFAGTGDKRAKEALFSRVVELHKLREGTDAVSLVSRPEFPTLETCLGLAAISLAMVLAGTGDLDALRLFKVLRWRHDKDISYGNHMIYGMAIGLLFLGGGTMTLGREPADIAALVAAFFPRFPMSSTDNQYHLQALRHLYALAVKRRELCAVDVDTGESVYVPVDVSAGPGSLPLRLSVPCLLLNSDTPMREATVISDKFYPIKLKLEKNRGCTFFVKRRTTRGGDGNAVTSFGVPMIGDTDSAALGHHGALGSLTDSPFLLAYGEYIIPTRKKLTSDFAGNVLLECIAEDAEESLPLYLSLSNAIQSMAKSGGSLATSNRRCGRCFPLWDLRLIRTYFERRKQHNEEHEQPSSRRSLVNPELLADLMERVERIVAEQVANDPSNLVWAMILYGDDTTPEDVVMG